LWRTTLKIKPVIHKPVMVSEVMEFLSPKNGGIYVDATLGLGGYTEAIFQRAPYAKVIGLDVDPDAIRGAKARLEHLSSQVEYINENFSLIDTVLSGLGIEEVDGIVADLGVSSYQIEQSGRGFSFTRDEPLDMRMDPRLKVTAAELISKSSEQELAAIIKEYGEEKWAKKIARDIVRARGRSPISTSLELADIVSASIPRKFHPRGIHPATRTFQAIRIAVNRELDNLRVFLAKSPLLLKQGGRIVIVSFHSLEDRIVKAEFKRLSSPCTCPPRLPVCVCGKKSVLRILTPSPITPSMEEAIENKRARSAKLRAGERI
jgi:16S rRNA (cytosine1402-N4)-methyltransferase